MKRHYFLLMIAVLLTTPLDLSATDYYISPTGSDTNDGLSQMTPFATLGAAQTLVQAGDIVYILPGTYQVTEDEISREESNGPYKIVFDMSKRGKKGSPISYIGVADGDGSRPVFDMSRVNPAGYRITAFLVTGQYLHFRNFEVTGLQVNITTHTQSENFRISDGRYNTFENIACHDGMGIGFYLNRKAAYNLIVNCDGYNNYDSVSGDGAGDQNDAFGCHVKADCPNNIFIGCRAWNNADDGFDLISCSSPVVFCYSIAYRNGYDADNVARHDGNGFKAGGYGMSGATSDVTSDNVPMHEVHHCLAVSNRSNGIYTNHHLGGVYFHDNTAFKNSRYNYSFVNRKGPGEDEVYDVDGYGHIVEQNLSVTESGKQNHVVSLNGGDGQNTITNNSFTWNPKGTGAWENPVYGTSLFESTKNADLLLARESDGMLSAQTQAFMKQKGSLGFGCSFDGYQEAVAAARNISGAGVETTRIGVVKTEQQKQSKVVYDLQGRQVAKPGQGLYIQNGQKLIIR